MFDAVCKKYKNDIDTITERGRLLWIRRQENEIWDPPLYEQY